MRIPVSFRLGDVNEMFTCGTLNLATSESRLANEWLRTMRTLKSEVIHVHQSKVRNYLTKSVAAAIARAIEHIRSDLRWRSAE